MRHSKIVIFFSILVIALGIAAISPEAAYRAISGHDGIEPTEKFNLQKQNSQEAWNKIRVRASRGDADAMYIWGNRLVHEWRLIEGVLVEPDSAGAERLFRKSAEAGNIEAMLAIWNLDGRDVDQLIHISNYAAESTSDTRVLGSVAFWLSNVEFETCNSDIRKASHTIEDAIEVAGSEIQHARFLAYIDGEILKKCTENGDRKIWR